VLLGPVAWSLGLGALALLLQRRGRARAAGWLGLAALGLLYLFSLQPVANGLTYLAEAGARSSFRADHVYDAVIVLGGALEPGATQASGEVQLNAASERLLRGFELLREGRARRALLSGGVVSPFPGAPVEAETMAALLTRWGIARERLVLEPRSRNTRENALEAAQLVARERWGSLLLLTSAAHLPRAAGAFRAVGLRPDTLAVDVRAVPPSWRALRLLPRAAHLAQSEHALRELAGRLVYRVRGYSVP
jgi:uncharacterized SAM-binding protein YcdF (DUF218 family)